MQWLETLTVSLGSENCYLSQVLANCMRYQSYIARKTCWLAQIWNSCSYRDLDWTTLFHAQANCKSLDPLRLLRSPEYKIMKICYCLKPYNQGYIFQVLPPPHKNWLANFIFQKGFGAFFCAVIESPLQIRAALT